MRRDSSRLLLSIVNIMACSVLLSSAFLASRSSGYSLSLSPFLRSSSSLSSIRFSNKHRSTIVRGFARPAFSQVSSSALQGSASSPQSASFTSPSDRDFEKHSTKVTFMFPGQGAQYVGMAASVASSCPAAKLLFDKASIILGYDLLDRCTNGPKELLDSTTVSQPAIFVSSMCALEKYKLENGEDAINEASAAMGLSLGEYSALCFAGAISFEDGVHITKARGEAMQDAADLKPSGMVSVIGLSSEKTAELCEEATKLSGEEIIVANYLCPGNYAASGSINACNVLKKIAKPDFGARMTVQLAVAGAFHTSYMSPAVSKLEEILNTITITKPRIPVISNVDALAHSDPHIIKQLLAKQVTSPVQWEASMRRVFDNGYEKGYEFGPGKVISGIVKRTDKEKVVLNVEV